LLQTGSVELLPALHETIGAAALIGAQFGFELEGPDGSGGVTRSSFQGDLRVLLVSGFGVVRAIGPHLLEDLAGLLQFLHLLRAGLAVVFGGIIHSEVLLLLRTVGLMKMLEADHDQFILGEVGMF
jgi:hypothetical protein